jgi:CRP/FNR family transcriptional regulator, cyclic AMP receptor protein
MRESEALQQGWRLSAITRNAQSLTSADERSRLGVSGCVMRTQIRQAESGSGTWPLKKIPKPLDFSPPSDNAEPTRGIGGIRSRRRTIARVITSRSFSSKPMAPCSGTGGDAAGMTKTTVESMATRVALHPFLAGMSRRHLALLAACALAVQFKKGQVIFREGEPANRFYLIETGKVILESSGGLTDPRLGWSWMFPPHTWNFTARAAEPITAIFFDGAILREYCEKDHSFGYEFLKRMSLVMYRRMQASRNKVLTSRDHSDTLQPGGTAAAFVGQEFDNASTC